ncbi:cell division protein ZapE [uncultured Thiohalocapsa sp.]|uniref:cell division protein ZapE n=1 Tax=uncultured Thiohalocapsa sp. TaxID=768990 RepID=UPI0025EE6665|nr:cell division protein ZapE [uncultured Thiohalocapsa sp.]
MTPSAAYRAAVDAGRLDADPAQQQAIGALDALHAALGASIPNAAARPGRLRGWTRRLLGGSTQAAPVPGLYIWGGVGRGKTLLMDLFHDALPIARKRRVHFHRFMQELHTALRGMTGRRDPLAHIGAALAAEAQVLCLDEMQVEDITDAMLMAGLLHTLFQHGVTLVTTSNMPPEALYRAGLQRERFLPAIDLLHRHCRVLALDGPTDYRRRQLEQAGVYVTPTGPAADSALGRHFRGLTAGAEARTDPILINDRPIPTVAWHGGVVWLDFDVICNIPRSKNDYVELARSCHTVLLANLRPLDDEQSDRAHRLVTLVDALYDRCCKLVCSADAAPPGLYRGRDMAFAFERTLSRLLEMQTDAYLARPHLG